MIPSTVQFITGMKLRELQRQREHFRDSYRRLRQDVEAAPDSVQRLRRLYEGLQELKFAGQPLHPEVVNLEMALRELEAGTLAPDVLSLC
jgi:predicted nuclease with TOPRIM domain